MHYTHTGKHAHNTSTHPKDICRLFSIQWLGIVIPNKESRVKFVVLRWWAQSDAEKVSCCQPQQSVSIMLSRCRRPDVFTIKCQDVWCTTAALVRALLNLTSCWIPFYILLLCPSVLEIFAIDLHHHRELISSWCGCVVLWMLKCVPWMLKSL